MIEQDRLDVFVAQTENVRALEQAWKHINKTINAAYVRDETATAEIHTKLLAQVYCAYAEALFSKVIHTPEGLSLDEISQIKSKNKKNVVEAWKKCLELSLQHIEGKSNGQKANTRQKIETLIDAYISDPSILRNKIAHGQWKVALNSKNTKVNSWLTAKIDNIDIVDLHRKKLALFCLFRIIEDIIESPNKAHKRDYWSHISEFESSQIKMSGWTLQDKISSLKNKKQHSKKV